MSSRALRRLQRERDNELCPVLPCPEAKGSDIDGTFDEEIPDTADSVHDSDTSNHKSSSSVPANVFDVVISLRLMLHQRKECGNQCPALLPLSTKFGYTLPLCVAKTNLFFGG